MNEEEFNKKIDEMLAQMSSVSPQESMRSPAGYQVVPKEPVISEGTQQTVTTEQTIPDSTRLSAIEKEIEAAKKAVEAANISGLPSDGRRPDPMDMPVVSGDLPATVKVYNDLRKQLAAERKELQKEPESDWKDWAKSLGVALGPALIGAALGKDPLGRAMGLTAGATASAGYGKAIAEREEKAQETKAAALKQIRDQEKAIQTEILKSLADAELLPQKIAGMMSEQLMKERIIPMLEAAKANKKLPPLLEAELDRLKDLNKAKADLLKGVPTKRVVKTEPKTTTGKVVPTSIGGMSTVLAVPAQQVRDQDVTKVQELSSKFYPIKNNVQKLEKQYREMRGLSLPLVEKDTKARQLYQNLLLRAKEYYNLGVLQKLDEDAMTKVIPKNVLEADIGQLVSLALKEGITPESALQGVKQLEKIIEGDYSQQILPYGYKYVPTKKIPLTKEQQEKLKALRGQK